MLREKKVQRENLCPLPNDVACSLSTKKTYVRQIGNENTSPIANNNKNMA